MIQDQTRPFDRYPVEHDVGAESPSGSPEGMTADFGIDVRPGDDGDGEHLEVVVAVGQYGGVRVGTVRA